ncbi:XdhC: predicted xanthine dehydrogenase iron-sulfur-binding subunit [Desulfosarcina variabilis str. Montpellier]|uniref:(2Fe-2S)-binding protein n=1 Tax=Desulfosarcina variabilis TaxID=2300 RepID=UPI003AFA02A4
MGDDQEPKNKSGSRLTRRTFLKTMGSSAVIAAGADSLTGFSQAAAAPAAPEKVVRIDFSVNDVRRSLVVEPRWTLLYVLREKLGIMGPKPGCERGECGACTVLVDGVSRYACLTLAVETDGCRITTIEGLMDGENLGPVQQAFAEHDAFQCGYCAPGQIMSAESLLRRNPSPDPDDIRSAMSGNVCRCGAYAHIHKAVSHAATLRQRK